MCHNKVMMLVKAVNGPNTDYSETVACNTAKPTVGLSHSVHTSSSSHHMISSVDGLKAAFLASFKMTGSKHRDYHIIMNSNITLVQLKGAT